MKRLRDIVIWGFLLLILVSYVGSYGYLQFQARKSGSKLTYTDGRELVLYFCKDQRKADFYNQIFAPLKKVDRVILGKEVVFFPPISNFRSYRTSFQSP
ncbi:MAG: hypothetical protein HKN23_07220 [Verrucomicrobiales bacterium]|nr:hypothetical protein [Verrucomicrobiales bacterium]